MEVQVYVDKVLNDSASKESQTRAKALAVQAVDEAGDNERLIAAAHMAAAIAEWRRGEARLSAKYVKRAASGMETTRVLHELLLTTARFRASDGDGKQANELLVWWRDHVSGPEAANMKKETEDALGSLMKPKKGSRQKQQIEKLKELLKPVGGKVNPKKK